MVSIGCETAAVCLTELDLLTIALSFRQSGGACQRISREILCPPPRPVRDDLGHVTGVSDAQSVSSFSLRDQPLMSVPSPGRSPPTAIDESATTVASQEMRIPFL